MKRRILALVVLVVLVMNVSAQAVNNRAINAAPTLEFDGATAECSVVCSGNVSDRINATLTLYEGDDFVDSWSGSGTTRVSVSGDCRVTRGRMYTLEVTWFINGVQQQSVSTTLRCPLVG